MDENWNPGSIKRLLNLSVAQLDQDTLAGLQAARLSVLDQYDVRRAHVNVFAWAGGQKFRRGSARGHSLHFWLGMLLVVAAVSGGIAYWQQLKDDDTTAVDVAILTGDFPIQYYID